jgi:glycosyltransferase involved in cell wall biosynthesis
MTSRRLLFLLPFPPRLDATHGGGRAAAQRIAALAARHRVALLCLREPNELPVDETLRARCELVEEVIHPRLGTGRVQRLARGWRLATSLLRLTPLWVGDWANAAYRERLRALAAAWRPDLVHVEYHVMAQYLSALDGSDAIRVLTEYEPGMRAGPFLMQLPPLLRGVIHRWDRLAWRGFEPAMIRRVQAVVVFTHDDQEILKKLNLPTPIVRIPLGTAIPNRPLNPLGDSPLSLVFVGSFIHPPNVDAALRLVHEIFPAVRSRVPEVKLYIVGDQPPLALRQTANAHITITGRVPTIEPYLDRAALFIAPLRLGGGMRVKVLEALAAGKAIIASPLAAEGLALQAGRELVLAEDDWEFVDHISALLSDPKRRADLAAAARAWACAHLSWDQAVEAHEQLYESLLAKTGAGRVQLLPDRPGVRERHAAR